MHSIEVHLQNCCRHTPTRHGSSCCWPSTKSQYVVADQFKHSPKYSCLNRHSRFQIKYAINICGYFFHNGRKDRLLTIYVDVQFVDIFNTYASIIICLFKHKYIFSYVRFHTLCMAFLNILFVNSFPVSHTEYETGNKLSCIAHKIAEDPVLTCLTGFTHRCRINDKLRVGCDTCGDLRVSARQAET